jgi:hypothetical protein
LDRFRADQLPYVDIAIEFLDNTLNGQLRARLVPLIDSEVSLGERVRLADRFLGFSVQA